VIEIVGVAVAVVGGVLLVPLCSLHPLHRVCIHHVRGRYLCYPNRVRGLVCNFLHVVQTIQIVLHDLLLLELNLLGLYDLVGILLRVPGRFLVIHLLV